MNSLSSSAAKHLSVVTALLILGATAEAQSVASIVRDSVGQPVPAALVVLVGGGERVSGTISTQAGAYRLTAPGPGEYTQDVRARAWG